MREERHNLSTVPGAGQRPRPSTPPVRLHYAAVSAADPQSHVLESPRLSIRTLARDDEPRLRAVFDAAPDWHAALGRPADPDAAGQELAGCAANPGRAVAVLTLRETGEDVGAAGWWLHRPEPSLALLGTLLVVPGQRGQGLAREALGALEGWLAENGVHELRTAFARRLHPLRSSRNED